MNLRAHISRLFHTAQWEREDGTILTRGRFHEITHEDVGHALQARAIPRKHTGWLLRLLLKA